jgi:alkylhydroperoxidase/carboxymuconolactone decarboxylase family protein YurZ
MGRQAHSREFPGTSIRSVGFRGTEELTMDSRDRLIIALAALLRAERETRAAFEAAIDDGVSREVLAAIIADPVPVITQVDIVAAEMLVESSNRYRPRAA